MLKLGIYDIRQLRRLAKRGLDRQRRFISIALYPRLVASGTAQADALSAEVLRRFPLGNRTNKRTYAGRFADFDREVMARLAPRLRDAGHIAVHDVAVSDGRTSCDFYRHLAGAFGSRCDFTASDYYTRVHVLMQPNSRISVVVDDDGALLQVIAPPFVFNIPKPENPLYYPLNRIVLAWLLARPVPRLLALAASSDALERETIQLFHPCCLRLAESTEPFKIIRHNVLERSPAQYTIIRAMNILNPGYFDPVQMQQIIRHLYDGLQEGGFLITGSNHAVDSPVDGGLFVREKGTFRDVYRSHAGSPVHDAIAGFRADTR